MVSPVTGIRCLVRPLCVEPCNQHPVRILCFISLTEFMNGKMSAYTYKKGLDTELILSVEIQYFSIFSKI